MTRIVWLILAAIAATAQTPHRIESGNTPVTFPGYPLEPRLQYWNIWGPWQLSGALYAIVDAGTRPNVELRIYKSSDGQTWTEQDTAHRVIWQGTEFNWPDACGAAVSQGKIWLAYSIATTAPVSSMYTARLELRSFDPATGLWSADIDGPTWTAGDNAASTATQKSFLFASAQNLIWLRSVKYPPGLRESVYDTQAATWTETESEKSEDANHRALAAVVNSATGRVHVIASFNDDSQRLYWKTIAPDRTAANWQQIAGSGTANPGTDSIRQLMSLVGIPAVHQGKVIVPARMIPTGETNGVMAVLKSDGETGTPSWTWETVDAAHPPDNSYPILSKPYNSSLAISDPAGLFVFWATADDGRYPDFNSGENELRMSSNAGSGWTASALVASSTTINSTITDYAYTPGDLTYPIHNVSAQRCGDGWGVLFDQVMQTKAPPNPTSEETTYFVGANCGAVPTARSYKRGVISPGP